MPGAKKKKGMKIYIPFEPVTGFLANYPTEICTYVHQRTSLTMLFTVSLEIFLNWKQHRYS